MANGGNTVALGYVRVSTARQLAEGDGLAVQRDKVRGWCAFQGLTLEAVFEDQAISGATIDNRPGLRTALRRALEVGPGAVLVFYKLDRLGRSSIDVQETLAVLLDAGVRVVSLVDGVDSASGMGAAMLRLLTSILATFAELEKETIRSRMLDGRRRADAQNRKYAVEPAYGRRARDGSKDLIVDEGEARAVARILELYADNFSIRAICAQLLEEGIAPRRSKTWSTAVVHRIATGHRAARKTKKTNRLTRARAELLAEGGSP